MQKQLIFTKGLWIIGIICLIFFVFGLSKVNAQFENPQTGGIGLQGQISAPAPTSSPTISTPTSGQVLTNIPQEVRGLCTSGLLVKLFKNNVFSGSAICQNGSYSILIDLFTGANELVARHYDDLDQAGPDSNIVSVIFNDSSRRVGITERIIMTSVFARRGTNPGQELFWPITISGGKAPYAVSVDWGEGDINDVYVVSTPGEFKIKHTYKQAGIYRVLIKATDSEGNIGFLQITVIVNGETAIDQSTNANNNNACNDTKDYLWQSLIIIIPLMLLSFYLGKNYSVSRIKHKLSRGEHPFE